MIPDVSKKTLENGLSSSGVSFTTQYLGNVPVTESIGLMEPGFMRQLVVEECIRIIAARHNLVPDAFYKIPNNVVRKILSVDDVTVPAINGLTVELNVNAQQIRVLHNKSIKVVHHIRDISFASMLSLGVSFLGYVYKKDELRKCFVFQVADKNVMLALRKALELYEKNAPPFEEDDKDSSSVPSNDSTPRVETSDTSIASVSQQPVAETSQTKADHSKNSSPLLSSKNLSCSPPTWNPEIANPSNQQQKKDASFTLNTKLFDMHDQYWYHGLINNKEAESLLTLPGDFLVRHSSNEQNLVLSTCKAPGLFSHILIVENGKVRMQTTVYDSVSALINEYLNSGAALRSQESEFFLVRGITRPSHIIIPPAYQISAAHTTFDNRDKQ